MQKHDLHWRRSLGWVEKWQRRRRLGKWQPRTLQDDRGDSGCGSLSSLTYMGICLRSKWPREVCDLLMASNDLTVNPGSVGCPAYDDPGDDPHVSKAGSLHARYAIIEE